MKIYLEFIFIINFLLDFMILYGTKRVLKRDVKLYRLFFGSLVGSFTTFLLFIKLSAFYLMICKAFFSLIIIIITFGFRNIKDNILYFYLISIIVGGIMYLFDLPDNIYSTYLMLIFGGFFVIYIFVRELLSYKMTYTNKYKVSIYYHNNIYNLDGFIDTGNSLVSPYKRKAIILVNLKLDYDRPIFVPYKALNTSGIIPCVKADKIIINDKEVKNCLIGLADKKITIKGFNCILPNKIREDLC